MINPPPIRTGHANPFSSAVDSKIPNIATFSRLRRDSCGLVNENFDANEMAAMSGLERAEVGDGLAGSRIDAFECPQNCNEVPVAFLRKISD